MSLSNKKFLVSGCGFSWSGQERKTWVNVLRSVGVDIVDVGGPAVSNQWIINRAFQELLANQYDHAIIQITGLGKLDVEVDFAREAQLVKSDSLRNFVIDGIWPSSYSQEHPAKAMYQNLLFSPRLETEDLYCKLLMLDNWCQTHNTHLTVLQAYDIPWTDSQLQQLEKIIHNINTPLADQYKASSHYQHHDHRGQNTVPCMQYHCELAHSVAELLMPEVLDKITKIQHHLAKS